jgi:hypothetical protein
MGANAVTTVPVYTAGEVLTAADLNITNSGIPVFATTTTRDAAFGGAGEKTLAEGQFAYIEASNATQYYDGAAWQSVGVAPGLEYITGATFTTATSFSLPTSTFTSTYRNYRVVINLSALTANSTFTMRLRASGTDNTGTNYNTAWVGLNSSGTSTNNNELNTSSWFLGESNTNVFYNVSFDIFQPQTATNTTYAGQRTYVNTAGTAHVIQSGGGQFTGTTQFDSLSFISSTASSMTGTYRVMGYKD